jgi:D-tyrosyl-tRNA(Tyr) deacylase
VRTVLQRVLRASVSVDDVIIGQIDRGLVAFVGVATGDGPTDLAYTTSKVRDARVFSDDQGRMNRSLADVGGALLLVSQFTLLGDVRHGRRPAFDGAAPPDDARALYEALAHELRASGLVVETGRFQAHMRVELVNDGPVTLLVDSRRAF